MIYSAADLTRSAGTLKSRADRVIAFYALGGALLVGGILSALPGGHATVLTWAIGFIVGGLIGEAKSFDTKLRAQLVACLVAIEANTRR